MTATRGVVYIHSAPSALCPHIEWAVGGVFGTPVSLDWRAQPAERSTYRTEYEWTGPVGSAARLTSVLKGWGRVRFEVTEDATAHSEAERYCFTPRLGAFRATVGPHGDILVSEDRIRSAVARSAGDGAVLLAALDELLGTSWDAELEPFRHAADGAPVRWLHRVG